MVVTQSWIQGLLKNEHRTSQMGRNLPVIAKHSSASCPIVAVSKSCGHCGSLIPDNSGVTDLTRQPSALMEAASAQREFLFVALTAWSCPAIEFTPGTFWQRTHTKIQKAVIFNLTDTEGLCVCECVWVCVVQANSPTDGRIPGNAV